MRGLVNQTLTLIKYKFIYHQSLSKSLYYLLLELPLDKCLEVHFFPELSGVDLFLDISNKVWTLELLSDIFHDSLQLLMSVMKLDVLVLHGRPYCVCHLHEKW
jgi:hypothetical protein